MIGTSLNQYRITATIGAGGMGEVFRARDMRLNRDVAIKLLPKDFVADADRLRRFEQEAKTLAALNHPNILTIHDAGVHEGAPYLVSELLEGKTLREVLGRDAFHGVPEIPLRKATEYAVQIAHGLAAAHGKGIIHRDLKPENIFVTKDGRVKILDFGLAKLKVGTRSTASQTTEKVRDGVESVPTIRVDANAIINTTGPGMVLGTPAYMSPEQVRGEPADHRADIFAFGAVLYEMLTGARAFRRDTPVASMNAVLSEEPPDLSVSNVNVPALLERVVRRCLEKQPDNRFQSARDLAFAIESIAAPQEARRGSQHESGVTRRGRLWRGWAGLGASVVLIAVAFVAGRWRWEEKAKEPLVWHAQRLGGPTVAFKPMVSPDGKELAFAPMENGITQLGVMLVDSGDWRVLTTNRTLGNVGALCWSRDGAELFYERWSGTSLGIFRISKMGGEERRIIENGEVPQMLPDGSMLLLRGGKDRFLRLHRHWLGGEKLEPLNAITGYSQFGVPYRILPGGKEVIFHGWPSDSNTSQAGVWLLNLQTDRCELLSANPPKPLLEWASPPHVPHPVDGSIFNVETVGDGYRIMRRTRERYADSRPALSLTLAPVDLDISSDGSLYVNQVERPIVILRYSDSNRVERLPLSASYETPDYLAMPGGRLLVSSRVAGKHRLVALSRDKEAVPFLSSREESRGPLASLGRDRILCRVGSPSKWAVSIVSIESGRVLGQLNSIPADETLRSLASSPDGKTIYFVASGSVWSVAVAGGIPEKLRSGDGVAADPNGAYLLVQINQPEANQLVRVPLPTGPERIIVTRYALTGNPLSPTSINPDGRVAVQVALPDSWYWPAAILDPETGNMELVPEDNADMKTPGWDEHGHMVVAAVFVRSSLWRFRPEHFNLK